MCFWFCKVPGIAFILYTLTFTEGGRRFMVAWRKEEVLRG